MASLATSALDINDGQGVIEALNNTGVNGNLCGGFTIRARVPFSPWDTLQTTIGVTVQGAEVTDVYGVAFPTYSNTSTLDHRYVTCHSFCSATCSPMQEGDCRLWLGQQI